MQLKLVDSISSWNTSSTNKFSTRRCVARVNKNRNKQNNHHGISMKKVSLPLSHIFHGHSCPLVATLSPFVEVREVIVQVFTNHICRMWKDEMVGQKNGENLLWFLSAVWKPFLQILPRENIVFPLKHEKLNYWSNSYGTHIECKFVGNQETYLSIGSKLSYQTPWETGLAKPGRPFTRIMALQRAVHATPLAFLHGNCVYTDIYMYTQDATRFPRWFHISNIYIAVKTSQQLIMLIKYSSLFNNSEDIVEHMLTCLAVKWL